MYIFVEPGSPEHELLACRKDLCNQSLAFPNEDFEIRLENLHITPSLLDDLVDTLNVPLPRRHIQDGKDLKWDRVSIHNCSYERADDESYDRYEHCKQDDICVLASALRSRTHELELYDSTEFVSCLTWDLDSDQLELNSLRIVDDHVFHDAILRLSDVIPRSAPLTKLHLCLCFFGLPHEVFQCLSNAIFLRELRLELSDRTQAYQLERILSNLVVGDDGNGVVVRLLQNPQSQLQHLYLNDMSLEDHHFIAIAQLLPTSHLKVLHVARNNIQSHGILKFAKQLPRIKSLKRVNLRMNPWLDSWACYAQVEECGVALVQGMMENYSVEDLDSDECFDEDTLVGFPQRPLLMHFSDINRGGRHIQAASHCIPLGLWPYVLERAGTTILYASRHKV